MISKPIGKTYVKDHLVSTVELPGDLWFETMVFQIDELDRWNEKEVQRYDTRDEAVVGHRIMVGKWRHLLNDDEVCFDCGDPTDGDHITDENEFGDQQELPICRACRFDRFGKDNEEV